MNRRNRILLIGDAMIDTYIYGSVSRVSPEAPVPIICPTREEHRLGGAANVARNAAALDSIVTVMFVVGNDDGADILKEQLDSWGVNCELLIQDGSQRTINKMRVVGNNQQIVRIDFHDSYQVSNTLQQQLIEKFETVVDQQDIIIISDYGKGTCTTSLCQKVIQICKAKSKPVIVDPKGAEWDKYWGASIITPNMKEVNIYAGKQVANESKEIEQAYKNLNNDIGVDYLLLTRSECGMSLLGNDAILHIPTVAQAVYDVSGAGDTVVAALASMLKQDMENIVETVRVANIAAGIVVAKPGTAIVTKEEIQAGIQRGDDGCQKSKIFTLKDYGQLLQMLKFWRTAGDIVVTTNGCFDIVHRGHVKLLQEARKFGDRLVVAINSDASVKRLKGVGRPINRELDRAYVISSLNAVDAVVIFDPEETPDELSLQEAAILSEKAKESAEEAPMALMRMIKPDIHVKGGDYKKEDVPEAIFASELLFVGLAEGYSTTNVIDKAAEEQS